MSKLYSFIKSIWDDLKDDSTKLILQFVFENEKKKFLHIYLLAFEFSFADAKDLFKKKKKPYLLAIQAYNLVNKYFRNNLNYIRLNGKCEINSKKI